MRVTGKFRLLSMSPALLRRFVYCVFLGVALVACGVDVVNSSGPVNTTKIPLAIIGATPSAQHEFAERGFVEGLHPSVASGASTVTDVDFSPPLGVGGVNAIAIGHDGFGLIAYFDITNAALKIGHCQNINCTSIAATTIETRGSLGAPGSISISLQIGNDGLGIIEYFHASPKGGYDVKVAHCSDMACTSITATVIANTPIADVYTSIIINSDGLPLMLYKSANFIGAPLVLRMFHCGLPTCASNRNDSDLIVDPSTSPGSKTTAMALGNDGRPVVVYTTNSSSLKMLRCFNASCISYESTAIIDSTPSLSPSVVIGSDGFPLISYQASGRLNVAHCNNQSCNSVTTHTLDANGFTGNNTNLAKGSDGLGVVSYWDNTNHILRIAHCLDVVCSSAAISTVIGSGNAGGGNGLAIGIDGLPLISGYNTSTKALEIAHCGNVDCIGLPPVGGNGSQGVIRFLIDNCMGTPGFDLDPPRTVNVWVRDLSAGGQWSQDSSLATEWGTNNCPAIGQPFEFVPPISGHIYGIIVVDSHKEGCTDQQPLTGCDINNEYLMLANPATGLVIRVSEG